MNGKLETGLLNSGNSNSLIRFDTYEQLGKHGIIKALNNHELAAKNLALKIVGCVDIKIQMKTKSGEFFQEFLITADNCLPCLLGLDFMIDQECILTLANNCCNV